LGLLAAAAAAIAVPGSAGAASQAGRRSLSFLNLHTEESLSTVYWTDGRYLPQAMEAIHRIFRDHRADEVAAMDPRLLDLLFDLRQRLGSQEPYHIISGYRSPATNQMLARQGRGVAPNSLHKEGQAADVRLPGRDLARVRRVAMEMKRGGVGYYQRSGFVHLDVGRVRYW
jgi:uncharacterized protein YcbK (DUF882 family)